MGSTLLGAQGEQLACDYLERAGFHIVARNWRCNIGEVDVVAREGKRWAVIEVKTRSGYGYGHPFESITQSKIARLRRLACRWAQENAVSLATLRLDAVAVTTLPDQPAVFEHLRDIG